MTEHSILAGVWDLWRDTTLTVSYVVLGIGISQILGRFSNHEGWPVFQVIHIEPEIISPVLESIKIFFVNSAKEQ
jgi:hypothetical protein